MKIVSVPIRKGGAGQTTTALNLAAARRDAGRKCLVNDLDPQASLSESLGIQEESEPNIYHLLKREASGDPAAPEEAILERSGMDVVPASLELASAELELVSVCGREQILSRILRSLQRQYDFALVDCLP